MAAGTEEHQTLVGDDSFVSLYRRYRPGTFGALRGQPHVVLALRSAVRDDRVGHAYLFSGPRGTGKTSTARILAKALNCTNLDDGEPCGVCTSCVEITKGTSLDVTELDAASNNGVDAMRDLVSHANLGTPGRWKVYIVDEVHMLSNAAANALLKTLEEPPSHVVFVLATTDPQKVPATIRSRTQHLEFRLLGSEVLEGLLRDVRTEAGLELDDVALATVVRRAKGSARDALSALDQVAASGVGVEVTPELAAVVEGLCEDDATRVLVSLAELHEAGWGPQQLATELVGELREGFLSLLAPSLSEAAESDRRRIADQATRLGLARLVRAMETLGRAQVEMRDAPEPQVVLEVALVKVARADLEDSAAALSERVARLERKLAELGATGGASPAPPTASAGLPAPAAPSEQRSVPAVPPRTAPTPAATQAPAAAPAAVVPPSTPPAEPAARPSLGALRRQRATGAAPIEHPSSPLPTAAEAPAAPTAAPPPASAVPGGRSPQEAGGTAGLPMLDCEQLTALWPEVLGSLPGKAKALLAAGRFVEVGTTVAFALPNAAHLAKASDVLGQLRASLAAHHAGASTVELVVDPSGPAPAEPGRALEEPTSGEDFEALEAEASDATNLGSLAETKILEAFPGAIEVTD